MNTQKKITILVFLFCSTLGIGQEILNVTTIRHLANYGGLDHIHMMDGKLMIALFNLTPDVYDEIPTLEYEYFDLPYSSDGHILRSSFLAQYDANIGFVDKDIFNHTSLDPNTVSIDDNKLLFADNKVHLGINNETILDIPLPGEEFHRSYIMLVYDQDSKDVIFEHVFATSRRLELRSAIKGDHIYINIPLNYNDDEDLIFYGDTLTFTDTNYYGCSNYLSKINYKTGEKIWTHHIGYGDVKQVMVDNENRINVDMISSHGPMFDFVSIGEEEDDAFGWYDRVIYRVAADGDFIDYTAVHTKNDAAVQGVEINEDGSFQIFGNISFPLVVEVEGDSLDFTDAHPDDQTKGMLLVYDKEMNYEWGQKIDGAGDKIVKACSKTPSGNMLISCRTESKEVIVDNKTFMSAPAPNSWEDPFSQTVLIQFDNSGNLLGDVQFTQVGINIVNIASFADDHHLLSIEMNGPYGFDLGGYFIDGVWQSGLNIIEFEGDIFNVPTSTTNVQEIKESVVYPNPIIAGGILNIRDDVFSQLQLIDEKGILINEQLITKGQYIIPDTIVPGKYYIKLSNKLIHKTFPIIVL